MLLALVLAWAVRTFVAAPFSIPSGSMLPNLLVGDYLVAAKWPYGYSRYSFPWELPAFEGRILARLPQRGDIVVFRAPGTGEEFIKRVIGLPGDRIEVRAGIPVVNGKAAARRTMGTAFVPLSANSPCPAMYRADGACRYPQFLETLPGGASFRVIDQRHGAADWMPPLAVPDDHLFLMGDNRDDSLDSRFPVAEGGIGLVPMENLVGRAGLIFWSTDGTAEYWKPWTWFSALRSERLGRSLSEGAQ